MRQACVFFTIILMSTFTFAQEGGEEESFRSSFVEGNTLMEEFNFSVALDVWMDVVKNNPDNANVSYKIGVCLWKLPKRRSESLPYFQKAVANGSEKYNPFS